MSVCVSVCGWGGVGGAWSAAGCAVHPLSPLPPPPPLSCPHQPANQHPPFPPAASPPRLATWISPCWTVTADRVGGSRRSWGGGGGGAGGHCMPAHPHSRPSTHSPLPPNLPPPLLLLLLLLLRRVGPGSQAAVQEEPAEPGAPVCRRGAAPPLPPAARVRGEGTARRCQRCCPGTLLDPPAVTSPSPLPPTPLQQCSAPPPPLLPSNLHHSSSLCAAHAHVHHPRVTRVLPCPAQRDESHTHAQGGGGGKVGKAAGGWGRGTEGVDGGEKLCGWQQLWRESCCIVLSSQAQQGRGGGGRRGGAPTTRSM